MGQLQRQTRRTKNNQYQDQNNHHHLTKDNIVNAIRRVTLNSFTVKGLIEAELKFVLDDDNDVSESDHKKKKKNEEEQRRKELFESHCFHCRCAPCIAEEKEEEESKVETELEPTTRTGSSSSTSYELEAMEFIENVIVGGYCTASDALQKSKNAPDNIVQTNIFRKAMIDTSILQASIALDVELALGFQQLALQSIELRCREFRFGCHPYHDDHDDDDNHDDDDDNYHNIEIAYEILRGLLLSSIYAVSDNDENDGKDDDDDEDRMNINNKIEKQKQIKRARRILCLHYGESYPYKQTLDTL